MKAYIIEFIEYLPAGGNHPAGHISQVGYSTLEAAQAYVEGKPGPLVAVTPMYYKTADGNKQYVIHDILIEDQREEVLPPATPYERTKAAVAATGNKWAIENFKATHE